MLRTTSRSVLALCGLVAFACSQGDRNVGSHDGTTSVAQPLAASAEDRVFPPLHRTVHGPKDTDQSCIVTTEGGVTTRRASATITTVGSQATFELVEGFQPLGTRNEFNLDVAFKLAGEIIL